MLDSIFVLRDVDDIAQGGGEQSRFGALLSHNTRRFRDVDGLLTSSSMEFAAAAFVVATEPIMHPPFVSTHPRVVLATPRWNDERQCGLMIDLATPIVSEFARHLPLHAAGWGRDADGGRYIPLENESRLTAYGRLTVRVPMPVDLLPEPKYTGTGVAAVETAKRALRALTTHANSLLTHLITALDLHDRGGGVPEPSGFPS